MKRCNNFMFGLMKIVLSRFSRVRLFATLCVVALQAPLSMGILQARILEWVAMPFSRDVPNSGIEPRSPELQVDSLPAELPGKPMLRSK